MAPVNIFSSMSHANINTLKAVFENRVLYCPNALLTVELQDYAVLKSIFIIIL